MTLEECTIRLIQIDNEYQKAKDNAAYHIGDIIEANGTAIVVERILGRRNEWGIKSNTYCIYQGHALTKRLQPRKDEWVTTISDDGGRDIKLVKKAKEG